MNKSVINIPAQFWGRHLSHTASISLTIRNCQTLSSVTTPLLFTTNVQEFKLFRILGTICYFILTVLVFKGVLICTVISHCDLISFFDD
jgi:hypothetical protein